MGSEPTTSSMKHHTYTTRLTSPTEIEQLTTVLKLLRNCLIKNGLLEMNCFIAASNEKQEIK